MIQEKKSDRERLRTILKVEVVRMSELKKGDKFMVMEDGAFLHDGRLLVADSDGNLNTEKDMGIVEAHVI